MAVYSNPVDVTETRLTHAIDELLCAARFVRTEVITLAFEGTCFERPLSVRVPELCTAMGKALAWLERFCYLADLKDNLFQQVSAAYHKERDSLPQLPPDYQKGG